MPWSKLWGGFVDVIHSESQENSLFTDCHEEFIVKASPCLWFYCWHWIVSEKAFQTKPACFLYDWLCNDICRVTRRGHRWRFSEWDRTLIQWDHSRLRIKLRFQKVIYNAAEDVTSWINHLTAICRCTNVTISSWFLYDDEVKEVICIHGDVGPCRDQSGWHWCKPIDIAGGKLGSLPDPFGFVVGCKGAPGSVMSWALWWGQQRAVRWACWAISKTCWAKSGAWWAIRRA